MTELALHLLGAKLALGPAKAAIVLPTIGWALIGSVLAAPQRRIARGRLAAALWPDQDDEAARRFLATALWRLKRQLGALRTPLQAGKETIALADDDDTWIDAIAFERGVEVVLADPAKLDHAADRETLKHALGHYRGDFLEFSDIDAIVIERERLRALYLDAALELARACKRHGDWRTACELGRTICTVEPLREDAQRLLMEAMVACGNRAQAVQHYREFERLLAEELAVRPMRETRDLAASIAQAPAAHEQAPDKPARGDTPHRETLLRARQQLAESLSLLDRALSQ
ncbi:AfsR/SARP family transcriptional regulator [Sphingomonas sp. PB4P5]|uniref:AfsR/SARP family transcriptional regulator n=1 Tax=Parasphingomonas puruogangriensis TaxID=3096155 RepID=UPI002FC6B119